MISLGFQSKDVGESLNENKALSKSRTPQKHKRKKWVGEHTCVVGKYRCQTKALPICRDLSREKNKKMRGTRLSFSVQSDRIS